jgi:hypothetical protein
MSLFDGYQTLSDGTMVPRSTYSQVSSPAASAEGTQSPPSPPKRGVEDIDNQSATRTGVSSPAASAEGTQSPPSPPKRGVEDIDNQSATRTGVSSPLTEVRRIKMVTSLHPDVISILRQLSKSTGKGMNRIIEDALLPVLGLKR